MKKNRMTKHRLEQYTNLRREITVLTEKLMSSKKDIVTDSVQCSSSTMPYQQHNVTIQGYDVDVIPRLSARRAAKVAECKAIEIYIDAIDDSIMWQLLYRRYIEGHSLKDTAELVGFSEKQASRLINGFFEKMSVDVC